MTFDDDKATLEFSKTACETIANMHAQAHLVQERWRHIDPEIAAKTNGSLVRQLAHLCTTFFGQHQVIHRDSDLSLFVSTPSIVYGVIFHRRHRPDMPLPTDLRLGLPAPMEGRYCVFAPDGKVCGKPVENGKRTCDHVYVEGHFDGDGCVFPDPGHFTSPEPPIGVLPVPGEWSFHS